MQGVSVEQGHTQQTETNQTHAYLEKPCVSASSKDITHISSGKAIIAHMHINRGKACTRLGFDGLRDKHVSAWAYDAMSG